MAKLWCPICKTAFPSQTDINTHLLHRHNHKVTPQTENLYRKMQNQKWQAREEQLDIRLRENTHIRRLEWESFAKHPRDKDVPTTGMDEGLVREMVLLGEVGDDSDSKGVEWAGKGKDMVNGATSPRKLNEEQNMNGTTKKAKVPDPLRERICQHLADFQNKGTTPNAHEEEADDADDEMETELQRSWREEDDDDD